MSTSRHNPASTQHLAPAAAAAAPCRLGERFGEHAQFGKQRALQLLREHLAGLRLDSTQVCCMCGWTGRQAGWGVVAG